MTTIKEAKEMIGSILEANPEREDDMIMIGVDKCYLFDFLDDRKITLIKNGKSITYEKVLELPTDFTGVWIY
jgi:hypothetical protein